MGIRCYCPNGHKLNLKSHLAGQRGICPECGVRFIIPDAESLAVGEPDFPTGKPDIATEEKAEPQTKEVPIPAVPPIVPPEVPDIPIAQKVSDSAETYELKLDQPVSQAVTGGELPKIVVSDHQKVVTIRTKAKRGARNTATFWLAITAILLIMVLVLLLR